MRGIISVGALGLPPLDPFLNSGRSDCRQKVIDESHRTAISIEEQLETIWKPERRSLPLQKRVDIVACIHREEWKVVSDKHYFIPLLNFYRIVSQKCILARENK